MPKVIVTAQVEDSAKWEKGFRTHGDLCLPKSLYPLLQLRLRPPLDTLLSHDVRAALAPPDPPRIGAFARGPSV